LSEFWLPCQREGVSISEIASETLGRLDVFLSDVLASIPEKDRLVFLSSYTTGHPTAPLWDEKKWEQADIVLHTTSVALREAEITGNWFIPTPLIGAFSRQALQVCATLSAAETQGYGDLQSMIWQVAVEAGFEVTLSNLTGKEHLSPAGYRYCPLEPGRKRVPDAVASSRPRGTESPGRLHLAEDVVVISLPERKDRQERIAALLERERIAFRFVEGVRVKFEDVSPEEYADCFWNDFKLQGGRENYIVGMAGCKRAHLRCLQHAYESGFESLLIFEDDMALEEGWREVLERAVQELPRGWHQLCLSATLYREAQPYSAHLKRITASYKNTAILFSKEGIASALKAGLKARNEIDCCWTEHVHPFGLSFVVHPQITYQTGGFSSIVNVVRDRTA
jgi:hypothetical protein